MGAPERQCIGCGKRIPQSDLVRLTAVAREGANPIVVVADRRHSGRGAYLCRRRACLERALVRKAFQRAFRTSVEVDMGLLEAAMCILKGE